MTDNLREFLSAREKQKFAQDSGTGQHLKMQRIIIGGNIEEGDADLVSRIKSNPALLPFFSPESRTEVPIAGLWQGKFISRRIDRLIVNEAQKTVLFLDYKTDINKDAFHDKYIYQIKEYAGLLRGIYPDYLVRGFILWLHDFELEKIDNS